MHDLLVSQNAEPRNRALTATPSEPVRRLDPPRVAPVLVLEDVSKWYGPVIGVNQVSLELGPGITGLVGHNGAGKSTLLQLAAGLIAPDLGRVLVCGVNAATPAAKRHVGFCPDLDQFFEDMTGRAFLMTIAQLNGYARAEAARRVQEMLELVNMNQSADRPLSSYSKGMRQRIKLAQAILHDPALVLLDEPLSGVDPVGRRDLVAVFLKLSRQGKCLLVSSHELDELEKLTDRVAIMAAGRIAAVGTRTQIRELLDQHPHAIRIVCDRCTELAQTALTWQDVVGIERVGDELLIRTTSPARFFERVSHFVLEEHVEIQRLETLDESTADVLQYLLGGKRA
jgi:ABC-2 type transport system ATP-binding protein